MAQDTALTLHVPQHDENLYRGQETEALVA